LKLVGPESGHVGEIFSRRAFDYFLKALNVGLVEHHGFSIKLSELTLPLTLLLPFKNGSVFFLVCLLLIIHVLLGG